MKIAFLTSAHYPDDERIFHHQATALAAKHQVFIISSKRKKQTHFNNILIDSFDDNGITKRKKINIFFEKLSVHNPERIICSEPITILAAHRYKKLNPCIIFYDITEWYPSKKNLCLHFIKNIYLVTKLFFFNLYATSFADKFIFGEYYKSIPYRIFFPFKKYIYTSYYPDLRFFSSPHTEPITNKLVLSYSGKISVEKGFTRFVNVVSILAKKHCELKIELKIIGWYSDSIDEEKYSLYLSTLPKNVNVKQMPKLSLEEYIKEISDTHVFLDLRSGDIENQHCLPIKLFYYMASARPVIFTKLKAIKKALDISPFGTLVHPDDTQYVADLISEYITNKEKYISHCLQARAYAERQYNWDKIKDNFIRFVTTND
ncbi:MAG: glycosyltransferase [Cytophagaceae bacterium]|nr:glycosyltransferase [Cytophagaceae bacterium]MDW8455802.1 glycosyltransferase [Cytophagaceae bacterium]